MKKSYLCLIFIVSFLIIISQTCYAQKLFINEFMASNSSVIRDPDYNSYADWVEIYNAEEFEVNLKNYFITDDLTNSQKYKFTADLIIPAEGYLIIWTDDMNTGAHTNFKLSASGESIGLYNPSNIEVDKYTFGIQQSDISEGRFPDGGTGWFTFKPSSPAAANDENNIFNRISDPAFSSPGGFYGSPILLTLSHVQQGVNIYYTTDGTIPTQNSFLYQNPISISATTVITARAFKENFLPSRGTVNSYFINFSSELPVFSIVTDPANFFSDTAGIYITGTNGIPGNCSTIPRNWNQDWERPVNLEFFETNKTPAFNVKSGVKIYGSCSRLYDMKSLAFYFRSIYGFKELNYRLFPDLPILNYNNFILRSAGQDWYRTMFREGMVHTLVEQGLNISYQEYRPSLVFINGEYWGIHNIREKINEHYLFSRYGVDPENIDLVEISKGISANNGDLNAYNSMIDFLTLNDLSVPENYNYIKSIVDIDDYIDYQVAEIYSANGDWPGSNMKLWRERSAYGKWKWLLYDCDFTFGGNAHGQYYTNTLEQATAENGPDWPNPPWSTLMFRMMLNNQEFKNEFIQRFAVHMNTTFEPEHVKSVIDSLGAVIENEIPRHKERWLKSVSMGPDWYENVQVMKDFADLRQPEIRTHFNSYFNLQGSYSLIISRNNAEWGKIFTHNIEVKENGSKNVFFKNISLNLKASAMPGYRFVRWEGASDSFSSEITLLTSENSYLTAVFEPAELVVTLPVINEINYNSSSEFDTEDWIEFFNPVNEQVDLTDWRIMDDNPDNIFIFPAGVKISGNGYLVVCRDTAKFSSLHLSASNIYGNLNFGLSSAGDAVLLLNSEGKLIDSVSFQNSGEWTLLPDGGGATLSLINPQCDNTLPINWRASNLYGTPGKLNDTYSKTENERSVNLNFYLFDNYPNPFNPETKIRFTLPSILTRQIPEVTLSVYDVLGRQVAILLNESKPEGTYEISWNALNLPTGVYFYRLRAGNYVSVKKMLLIK